jgi:AraC-like DNA-binding protein
MGSIAHTATSNALSRGETVSTIINDARIELAQRHIKTVRRSLTETAQLLGFSGSPTSR